MAFLKDFEEELFLEMMKLLREAFAKIGLAPREPILIDIKRFCHGRTNLLKHRNEQTNVTVQNFLLMPGK